MVSSDFGAPRLPCRHKAVAKTEYWTQGAGFGGLGVQGLRLRV